VNTTNFGINSSGILMQSNTLTTLNGILKPLLKGNNLKAILVVAGLMILQEDASSQLSSINIKLGVRYRLTPIHLSGYSSVLINPDPPVLIQQDGHLAGTALFAELEYFTNKRLSIYTKIHSRYDQFTQTTDQNGNILNTKKKIFFDHEIGIKYLLGNTSQKLSVGTSIVKGNLNSGFTYEKYTRDDNGNYIVTHKKSDFGFWGFQTQAELSWKRFYTGLSISYLVNEKFPDKGPLMFISVYSAYKITGKRR